MELDTSRLDLNLLAALDVLLRERNVTRAAKKLGITQSAMSHKLKRLREELDDPLFVTAPGGLVPTARAESLEEPLRRALQDVAAAVRASAPFDPTTAEREVRVACVDAIELTLLPEILARLAREAPKIRLSIRRRGPRSMEELASGELDLIIAPGGVPGVGYDELPGVQRRLLGADGFACVVRADHPLVRKRLTLARFLELDHLLVTPGGHVTRRRGPDPREGWALAPRRGHHPELRQRALARRAHGSRAHVPDERGGGRFARGASARADTAHRAAHDPALPLLARAVPTRSRAPLDSRVRALHVHRHRARRLWSAGADFCGVMLRRWSASPTPGE